MKPSIRKQALPFTAAAVIGCWLVLPPSLVLAESNDNKSADSSVAAAPSDSLDERFADTNSSEIPDFQRHVIPLMGRLGCNGRACHGSFQGRGGFQLSLFGYDFDADHQAMLDESAGRVDVDDVDESLILVKPLDADAHEGGKRFDQGSWQHHVLRRWIQAGARMTPRNLSNW